MAHPANQISQSSIPASSDETSFDTGLSHVNDEDLFMIDRTADPLLGPHRYFPPPALFTRPPSPPPSPPPPPPPPENLPPWAAQGYGISSHPIKLEQPKLLVVELDGVLIGHPEKSGSKFYRRDDLHEFFNYIFDPTSPFKVMIWSDMLPTDLTFTLSKLLIPTHYADLVAVWSATSKGQWYWKESAATHKKLEKVWKDGRIQMQHPWGGVWDRKNTVLIDTSSQKAGDQPGVYIGVPEFCGWEGEERFVSGSVLKQLIWHLEMLQGVDDVRADMSAWPFEPY